MGVWCRNLYGRRYSLNIHTEDVIQNFAMSGYVKKITRLAYNLYDKSDADKIMKWVCIGYNKLRKKKADGITTKTFQLEVYLRSNEHTMGFMKLLDEKELM